jgi:carboxymethylenebutenolidase
MGEMVTIKGPDGAFGAYVARPSAGEGGPALVVIQEIFGVNKVMRDLTDAYAAQGFTAICPDLFWRIRPGIDITDQTPEEWKQAFDFYSRFDVDKGVADIAATVAHARAGGAKVGCVGYCLGGLLAFLTATRTDVDASVSYYGVGIEQKLDEASKRAKPLMLHVAEEDQFVSKEAQEKIRAALEGADGVAVHFYPGLDHAFARQGGEHFDAAGADLADGRTAEFLRTHLT